MKQLMNYTGDGEYSDLEPDVTNDDFPFDKGKLESEPENWSIYFILPDGTPIPKQFKVLEVVDDLFVIEDIEEQHHMAVIMTDDGVLEDGGKAKMIKRRSN